MFFKYFISTKSIGLFYLCLLQHKSHVNKKNKKILIHSLLSFLIGLTLLLVLLFEVVVFQSYVFNIISEKISAKMGGKILFNSFYLSPFSGLNIENLYIEDDKQDTLVYIEHLVIGLESIDFKKSAIRLNSVELTNGFYNLYSVNEREQTNMQYIINYLSSNTTDTTKNNFYLDINQLEISNLRFRYKSLKPEHSDYGVNFENIDLSRLDLNIANFTLINDSMNFELKHLFINEKSGLLVNNIKGLTTISSTEISLNNLILKTPSSHLFARDCSFRYKKWADLADFVKKVKMNFDLQLSTINILDISYFAPVLKNLDFPAFTQGHIYGTVSNLKSNDILLSLGESSRIKTSFSLNGLPEYKNTFLNLNIKNLQLDSKDTEAILKNQKGFENTQLPEIIKRIKHIHYKGNITGFLTDLVAYGTFDNNKGIINTDLRFKYKKASKIYFFEGRIKTENLNLSILNFSDTIFDKISMSGKISAEIDSTNNWSGILDGNISSVGINQYNYHNISAKANLNQSVLESQILLNDNNIIANLNSKMDFSTKESYFEITGQLKKANMTILNWWDRDSSSNLSFDINTKFTNLELDNILGELKINNLKYSENGRIIFSEEFIAQSTKINNEKSITINSNLFDSHFNGHFTTLDLNQNLLKLYHSYLPALSDTELKKEISEQDIRFDIKLKNSYSIFKIFSPSFLIANNSEIKGHLNSKENQITLYFISDSCRIKNNLAININTRINGDLNELNSDISIQNLFISNDLSLKSVNIKNKLRADSLNFYISWMDKKLQYESAEIMAETIFHSSTKDSINLDINMIPSYFFIEDSIWYVNDAKIAIRGSQKSIHQLIINNENQYLYANGTWQKETSDSLKILLNQINLAYFPYVQEKTNLKTRGIINGDITLTYKKSQPLASGHIRADSLTINDELLGNLSIDAHWETKTEQLVLDLVNRLGKKQFKSIKSTGYIDFKKSNINLNVELNKQKIAFFNPFVEPYLSDLKGYLSGNLNIQGQFDNIQYFGDLEFARAALTYNYLRTRYNFTDHVKITKDRFIFDKLKVFQIDGQGDYADINGYIQHNNFSDFQFFINIKAEDFMVLNTTQHDNDLYYGTAFLTGVIEFTGSQKNLNINIAAKTNKNTHFHIPLNNTEEASSSNFISFVNEMELKNPIDKYKLDLSGIILDFDLEISPETKIQLIFDDKLGDIVKAQGKGNLNMNINTLLDFTISGNYIIEKGEYLFTLQNVINKKFKIEQGSSIKWNGDPYQAFLNIDAIYRLKTPLYDLTLDEEDKERVPVECLLKMEKSLTSPEITFDINLPNTNNQASSLINAMDQEEKNIQLLSLMILNKFYTPDYLRGGEEVGSNNAVGKNASELLSNQLSSWLSQMSDDFDIGVNYHPGDEISNNELEVALSTQLFSNRVAIDGNIGVGEYENTNSNIIGNVNIDVKINKKGNVRIRGFNRDNQLENTSLYTQGVGLYYKEEFDSFGELLNKYWKKTIGTNNNKTQ